MDVSVHHMQYTQARNQLGTLGGRRVFLEGLKFFELFPIISIYIQHIFPGKAKIS